MTHPLRTIGWVGGLLATLLALIFGAVYLAVGTFVMETQP